jgi:uncharacterized protein (TIGR04255 family)
MQLGAPPREASSQRPQLARSPIALVVCQVRFDSHSVEAKQVLEMQRILGQGEYPGITQFAGPDVRLQLGDQFIPSTIRQDAWQLSTADGSWAITLGGESVALQTTNGYTTWEESFQPRLDVLVQAVQECIAPTMEQRLGLRYVNQLADLLVTGPGDLAQYFENSLLPGLQHELFGSALVAAQNQLVLRLDSDISCGLRLGFAPEGGHPNRYSGVVDIDLYRDTAQSFDPVQIMAAADIFNDRAHEIFRAALNPDYLGSLE